MTDGQYGDYLDAKVGDQKEFVRHVGGLVIEVGANYLIIVDDETGEEFTIDNDWEEV